MLSQTDKNILKNEDFRQLVKTRRWVSRLFLSILLGAYLAFGFLSVYSPATLAQPVIEGGTIPVGIAMGYTILGLIFSMTLVYVWLANTYFEPLERKVSGAER